MYQLAVSHCPVADVLARGAAELGDPVLAQAAAKLQEPVRAGVEGRPGAGRTTVRRALHAAGVPVSCGDTAPDITVYVFVETPTPEDRAALAAARPRVAVLNKADLCGFGGAGPMAAAADRCRALCRALENPRGPVVPLAALLAQVSLSADLFGELAALAASWHGPPGVGGAPVGAPLLEQLDLFGVAVALEALRRGADRAGVQTALRRASGIDALIAELGRVVAEVRYRRARSALTVLAARVAGPAASFLAGDDVVLARMASAAGVMQAAGFASAVAGAGSDPLRAAIGWQRYANGPVTALHRDSASDLARGALRQWAAAR